MLHPNKNDLMGAASLDDSVPLKSEMADFGNFFMSPIRLDRKGSMRNENTVSCYVWSISSFMGYLVHFKGIALQHLSLGIYTNQWLLLSHLEYKMQKLTAKQAINNAVAHTKAVSCTVKGMCVVLCTSAC